MGSQLSVTTAIGIPPKNQRGIYMLYFQKETRNMLSTSLAGQPQTDEPPF